jgi:Nitrile hydratase, alpha chain
VDISLVYSALALKAEQDPSFRAQLLADSRAVLTGLGIELPEGLTLHVTENTATTKYFVLPPRPDLPAAARWSTDDSSNVYGRLVAKAWSSPSFKALLLAEPQVAFAELGLEVPDQVTIRVVERTPQDAWLILPAATRTP